MYKAVVDVNTGVVYEWKNTSTEEIVVLDQTNWKPKEYWTTQEIESLFKKPEPVTPTLWSNQVWSNEAADD